MYVARLDVIPLHDLLTLPSIMNEIAFVSQTACLRLQNYYAFRRNLRDSILASSSWAPDVVSQFNLLVRLLARHDKDYTDVMFILICFIDRIMKKGRGFSSSSSSRGSSSSSGHRPISPTNSTSSSVSGYSSSDFAVTLPWKYCLAVSLVAGVVYANALEAGFAYDDR